MREWAGWEEAWGGGGDGMEWVLVNGWIVELEVEWMVGGLEKWIVDVVVEEWIAVVVVEEWMGALREGL